MIFPHGSGCYVEIRFVTCTKKLLISVRERANFPIFPQFLKTTSLLEQSIDTAENLSFLVYYPTEHLAWAADRNLIGIHSNHLWMTTTILWVVSLSLGIARALLHLTHIATQLDKKGEQNGRATDASSKRRREYLLQQRWLAVVTIVQNSADMVNAVNRLPAGVLWAGKVSPFLSGLFGTIASILGLYRLLS